MRWHMLEADVEPLGWWPPKTAVWQAPAAWMGGTLGWSNDFGLGFDGPEEAAEKGWRYVGPYTPPATVAALVEAVEAMREAASSYQAALLMTTGKPYPWPALDIADDKARAALTLYRGEDGR